MNKEKREQIKKLLSQLGVLPLLKFLRDSWVDIRIRFLRYAFPGGKYIRCNGARIFVKFNDPNHLWYYGKSESLAREIQSFKRLFAYKDPKVIIDVGAHWGIFPAMLDRENKLGRLGIERVVCIEPDPRNAKPLQMTVDKIQSFEVDVVHCAVSDQEQEIPIYRGGGACAQTYRRTTSVAPEMTVKAMPLSKILAQLGIPESDVTHIKLDIDGYEPAFFYGAEDFFKRYRPLLLIEFWAAGMKAAGFDVRKYWDFLHNMYNVAEITFSREGNLPLSVEHYDYIATKTSSGLVNLLLTPK